ncbi:hypothetical protein LCGC14_3015550 [marine sediment metagenome]|uniref:Uncharacterized protein n=1 Tax=marine sediment metagenome TaxID=412755 RepID=A0A0F8WWQ9_9ZZZZ
MIPHFDVKIVKCSKSVFWYANRIGEIYEAIEGPREMYELVEMVRYVRRDDCVKMTIEHDINIESMRLLFQELATGFAHILNEKKTGRRE